MNTKTSVCCRYTRFARISNAVITQVINKYRCNDPEFCVIREMVKT